LLVPQQDEPLALVIKGRLAPAIGRETIHQHHYTQYCQCKLKYAQYVISDRPPSSRRFAVSLPLTYRHARQPEGLPDSSRRSKQREDLWSAVKQTPHPEVVQEHWHRRKLVFAQEPKTNSRFFMDNTFHRLNVNLMKKDSLQIAPPVNC
jgi:hypothetical protein